eukprot:TRINITY_DN24533_c0_g1_i1.p1 TRINITY_DN24533_c0_g1~~TRINITY_DN24533_c0_g1_i1.p1  ORF type:complete len:114 (-),score=17.07 TRINITY_DN24533_c0_g1_i1:29-370(-)
MVFIFFFFDDSVSTQIYTILFVGSVRCVQETEIRSSLHHQLITNYSQCIIINTHTMILSTHYFRSQQFFPIKKSIKQNYQKNLLFLYKPIQPCLLYTSPSPRDRQKTRMPSSA